MKRHFGEYPFRLLQQSRKHGVSIDAVYDQFCDRLEPKLKLEDPNQYPAAILARLVYQAELTCLRGGGLHFFIETEALANKLILWGKRWDPKVMGILARDDHFGAGIIHTCGKGATALLYHWSPKNEMLVLADSSTEAYNVHAGISKEGLKYDAVRLLVGFALYKTAFPETIKEGFPDFAKHPAHYKGRRCSAVSITPKILSRTGPVPHFRNGYLKPLESPFYKNRRGEVIWVSECFVKGQPFTAEDNGSPCNS